MKKVLLMATCAVIFGAVSAMATEVGTVKPFAQQGSWSVAPGVFYYQGELEDSSKIQQNHVYGQLGYALTDKFEIYVQGGAADMDISDVSEMKDGYRPFGAIGVRAELSNPQPFSLGFVAQGTYYSNYSDSVGASTVKINQPYEVQGGLIIQSEWEGGYIYAGPMFFLKSNEIETTVGATVTKATLEENSNVGGVFGMRWPLDNGINIEIEGQYKTEISGGASIHFPF